jgi:hypothetical protein
MIVKPELPYITLPAVTPEKGERQTMPGQIRNLYRLRKKDIPKADAVLTDAFKHDPLWCRVLTESRAGQQRGLFEVPIRYCLRYGEVYTTSENLEGIIVWIPGHLGGYACLAADSQRSYPVRIKNGGSAILQTGTCV